MCSREGERVGERGRERERTNIIILSSSMYLFYYVSENYVMLNMFESYVRVKCITLIKYKVR